MPVEGIIEEDPEGRVVMVLREDPKTMTIKELARYERNMCPADIYDNEELEENPKKSASSKNKLDKLSEL